MAMGALIGSGIGYIAGNADDRALAEAQAKAEQDALERSRLSSDPATVYRPEQTNPLVGSTWRIISVVSDDELLSYSSMVITFQTNSKMTTLAVWEDGDVTTDVENYRVIDDVLIVSGTDYVLNAKWSVANKQLVVVGPSVRIVAEEVEERV